ncbi:MBOAT family protein [bacterium]|nr:MAG: MBOAT family protein [bacterium]
MVFSSIVFLSFFLPITIAIYYLLPKNNWRNLFLLFASLFFYAWGEPKIVFIMIFSICVNYIAGILIAKFYKKRNISRLVLAGSIFFNFGILFYYKYFNFFISNVNIFKSFLGQAPFVVSNVLLPIGISFYTFQSMSYIIDVYRDNNLVQKNVLKLGLFVALFPQLIAGPIVRYKDVQAQIDDREHSISKVSSGFERFIIGLAKKVIIANTMGSIADFVFGISFATVGSGVAWIGILAYSLQILFDFSGYSDMAIGLGRIFGFEFLENFNYPYISKSISEFWRRWHISLSNWFKDYLYIPLGGNRMGLERMYLNLFIVFICTGIWHGANWTFLIWGLWHGMFIMIEKLTNIHKYEGGNRGINILLHMYTLFVVVMGWVFFRSDSIKHAGQLMLRLFGYGASKGNVISYGSYIMTSKNLVVIILAIILSTPILKKLFEKLKTIKNGLIIKNGLLVLLLTLCYVILSNATFNPFIYFNF